MNQVATVGPLQKNQAVCATQLRYAHDLLFSLNLSLVLKLEGNQAPNRFFSVLDFGETSLQSTINAYLHLHPHHSVGANIAFMLLALALTLFVFVVLQILRANRFMGRLFRSVSGIVSLVALPVSWLWATHLIGVARPLPNPSRTFLYLELITAALCASLYLYAKWPVPGWITIAILALHFGYWNYLVSAGPYFWRETFRLIFPLAGFLATLLWGIYILNSKVGHESP